jgi:hypothetical protein
MMSVGRAVADTQTELNLTCAEMATLLSNTPVDVIVAEEEVFDDNGTLVGAKAYTSPVPLSTIIPPVINEFQSVWLQGIFIAEEFTAASATNITQVSANLTASAGKGKRRRSAPAISISVGASNINRTSQFASDRSSRQMRMSTQIGAKTIDLPKAKFVTVGPRIEFFLGGINPSTDNKERRAQVTIKYSKKDPDANDGSLIGIPGKRLSIEAPGLAWTYESNFVDDPTTTTDVDDPKKYDQTNIDGELKIALIRTFPDADANDEKKNPPIPVTLTARIALVSATPTVPI